MVNKVPVRTESVRYPIPSWALLKGLLGLRYHYRQRPLNVNTSKPKHLAASGVFPANATLVHPLLDLSKYGAIQSKAIRGIV